MKTGFSRVLASILMLLFALSPVWATCGGGGGGGTGGAGGGSSNGGPTPVVYNVPWKMYEAKTAPSKGLVLYWFPASNDELKRSPLKGSRVLTLYSSQCVAMSVADSREPDLQKFLGDSKPPVVVLATADGSPINKVENTAAS
jgi:hypothetical protein